MRVGSTDLFAAGLHCYGFYCSQRKTIETIVLVDLPILRGNGVE